jgi:hypothetical protein
VLYEQPIFSGDLPDIPDIAYESPNLPLGDSPKCVLSFYDSGLCCTKKLYFRDTQLGGSAINFRAPFYD